MAKKRVAPVKPVFVYEGDWPDGKRPEGVVDAMAEDLADFEASGGGIHDYQLGLEPWSGHADASDEKARAEGIASKTQHS
jgi:hypothetical protein